MSKANKIWLPGLVLLCLVCGLLSCRKENLNGIHSAADSTAVFSATVDGADWSTDSVSAFLVGDDRGKARIMTITGYTSERVISISLRDTSTGPNDSSMSVQQYPLERWGNASAFAYGNNRINFGPNVTWQEQGEAISGEANVTACDGENKRISGSFSFTARVLVIGTAGSGLSTDSVHVTNGVFKNIPYSYLKHP
ncbi:DUF6252 family protein [Flavitalea sp. BT771]|uniref:DUF6252 family protein n=1 Tax=Flavitalea sp. BT771 TaxID=3063329 RepID=UPI0026E2C21E|nr:DUF6252 family protein [Flavitalea sp. BT771]MDO6429831.1 DUF6252 family protein [Flavitalea sp. BT771]MDV6218041.1 DUF6252 family protein [Flavitalea sp. BT771]